VKQLSEWSSSILEDLEIVRKALDSPKSSDKENISAEPVEMLVKQVAA
jgi:hypothetical protein